MSSYFELQSSWYFNLRGKVVVNVYCDLSNDIWQSILAVIFCLRDVRGKAAVHMTILPPNDMYHETKQLLEHLNMADCVDVQKKREKDDCVYFSSSEVLAFFRHWADIDEAFR